MTASHTLGNGGHRVTTVYAFCDRDYPLAVWHRGNPARGARPELLRREEYAVAAMFAVVALVPVVAGVALLGRGDPRGYWALGVAGLLWLAAAVLTLDGAEWIRRRLIDRPGRADRESATRPAHDLRSLR